MPSQDVLRTQFEARIARVGQARPTPSTARHIGAIAVLRDFDAGAFVSSALAFARTLDQRQAAIWYGSFTRTIFLAGDPRNLTERHPCAYASPDGDVAWYGPGPLAEYASLRRLLRPWRGSRGVPVPFTQEISIAGQDAAGRARLDVPAMDLTVEDYLVNVNHLVVEAALDGLLAGVGRLVIRHLPAQPGRSGDHERIRVVRDPLSPQRLRAYAFLSVG
ncbi:DUF6182 family protein [Actinomadura fulvescens]|uniref:Uncharacterized protein n=1 Tax=Actinomadura fulvescens TaxID=46160 RepID=A0ABN3QXC4_9ACTN